MRRLLSLACALGSVYWVGCTRPSDAPPGSSNAAAAAVVSGSCPATNRQYFEFQVEQPATFLTTTISPRPDAKASDANLVQFVVDTAGLPVLETFKVLRRQDSALVRAAYGTAPRWRFQPATIGSRPVCQLVQTPLAR